MTRPAIDYIPQHIPARYRRQAFGVWSVAAAAAALWVLLILVPPVFAAAAADSVASPVFTFFGYICHQLPDRSFHLMGHQLGVCSRCFGVYFGLLAGVLAYPLWRRIDEIEPLPRVFLFASIIPMGIDWSLTFFGIWENTHASRFITGLILGVGCATFIIPAVVEIARYTLGRPAPASTA